MAFNITITANNPDELLFIPARYCQYILFPSSSRCRALEDCKFEYRPFKTITMYNIFLPLHVICVFFQQGIKLNLFRADRQRFESSTLWLLLLTPFTLKSILSVLRSDH